MLESWESKRESSIDKLGKYAIISVVEKMEEIHGS